MGVIHANDVKEKKPASSTGCELCKVKKCAFYIEFIRHLEIPW